GVATGGSATLDGAADETSAAGSAEGASASVGGGGAAAGFLRRKNPNIDLPGGFPHSKEAMDSRIRIIGGRWKRSKLPVPALEGLRPTPDRVRESLFNWLGQDLTGWDCLELFAG